MNYSNLSNTDQKKVINEILSMYPYMTEKSLNDFIRTTQIDGVCFVAINGYSSNASGHTEVANQLINVGASYENAVKKDAATLENVNLEYVSLKAENYNYDAIDRNGLSLDEYIQQVKMSLPVALAEMIAAKNNSGTGNRVDNDIWFNKVLVYNTNTKNLAIRGMQVNKTVEVKGDFKIVKSAPKTIAKKLIEKSINSRTATLRKFIVPNVIEHIKIDGKNLSLI